MPQFKTWIKRAVQQIVDPDRHERIPLLAAQLEQALRSQRKDFSIEEFGGSSGAANRDLETAKRLVYRKILERAWEDEKVTAAEAKTLDWVWERLAFPAAAAKAMEREFARHYFSVALAQAMEDGVLDDAETQRLEDIAGSAGYTLGEFVHAYFQLEGERFLRGIFSACTEGGELADDAWTRLIATGQRLGFSQADFEYAIRPQAQRFFEHVFADAESDRLLTEHEESFLRELLETLGLSQSYREYAESRIRSLRLIRLAGEGKLPSLPRPSHISIRSGEIVHFHSPATWVQRRRLKSGERIDNHDGVLTITDNRILFVSDTKSFDVKFYKIVGHDGRTGMILLRWANKPLSQIRLDERGPVAYAILECALALSNQTRLAKNEDKRSRHIPRDVRQRVWQRYGGQCAECHATDYLEFDHIVPVARGGSNSDANVQLLCRKCNVAKSDKI